jgi:transposase
MSTQTNGKLRTKRHHSLEFRQRAIDAALQPGASVAGVALAHGLNANLLRKWIKASGKAKCLDPLCIGQEGGALTALRVRIEAPVISEEQREIRLDIRRGGTTIQMAWPTVEIGKLGVLLQDLLR